MNAMPIETELGRIERCKERTKIEHIDKDVTHVLKRARSKAEG